MYCVPTPLYEETAARLDEAIDGRSYFSGTVAFRFGDIRCRLVASLIVRRERVSLPEGDAVAVVDLVPVWWEFHTEFPEGERLNDFSFPALRSKITSDRKFLCMHATASDHGTGTGKGTERGKSKGIGKGTAAVAATTIASTDASIPARTGAETSSGNFAETSSGTAARIRAKTAAGITTGTETETAAKAPSAKAPSAKAPSSETSSGTAARIRAKTAAGITTGTETETAAKAPSSETPGVGTAARVPIASAAPGPGPAPPSLERFALGVYPFLELEPFHRVYYRVLEAFARGRIRRLVVTMPPQHGKSVGASTLLPAYLVGLDPDLRVAIASYSAALASKFNRRVQRIIDSREYAAIFPATTIKHGTRPPDYIRTADEAEIIGRLGSILSVGREGSLTGNRVDCFLLDDLYKDAMEADSPIIRANCWEWYTSVVRTRMHNASREALVFTRWHEEDLVGTLAAREPVERLERWAQLEGMPPDTWAHLHFEAVKASPPTELDPRREGEALWEAQHGAALLDEKRRLDPVRFEAMYQGRPASREGLLYGEGFTCYDALPHEIVRRGNYTDTADTGDDMLCSLSYAVDADGAIYIVDAVYTDEPMEVTERAVAEMLRRSATREALVESNNGGRGFARAVQALAPAVKVTWFHQSANKEARILSHAATVLHLVRFPHDWNMRWPLLWQHLTTYRRRFRANRRHDAADVVTGIVEREAEPGDRGRVRGLRFV